MEAEIRKDSVQGCENNDNLSLRIFFPFLRESIREEDVDIEDIEEEINDKSEVDIRRKESEE